MVSSVYWEWELLIQSIQLGIKAAFVYDGVLLFRLLFSHKNIIVAVEDFLYWTYVTVIIFQLQLTQSNGVLRGFCVLGIVLGMAVYNRLFGERMMAFAETRIYLVKRRLTAIRKMLTIKLCKRVNATKKYRSKDDKKKNSGKKEKAESFRHDTGIDGSSDPDVSGGCE